MKLICRTKLHFRKGNSNKVYEVDLCETGEKYVVNFRYGRHGTALREGTKTNEPVSLEKAEKIFERLVNEKKRKGYHITEERKEEAEKSKSTTPKSVDEKKRIETILKKLTASNAKSDPRIERVIWRVGELKIKEATPHLIELLGTAKELRDYCIAWSLGFCGDEKTIPQLEKLLSHKADFVRRIAREAIFKLGDETKRNELIEKSISELPKVLQNLATRGTAKNFDKALGEIFKKQKTEAYDLLTRIYEIDNEITRSVLLDALKIIPLAPRAFRPIRHIYKMAEYRRDPEVFGAIARRFEIEKAVFHTSPWWDAVYFQKDDGTWEYINDRKKELAKENSRLAFSNRTKDYFCRRTWRTLRRLGELGNPDYVKLAVGALLAYSDEDEQETKTSVYYDYYHTGEWNWQNPLRKEIKWDTFSPYLLFNHILYENSPRYELKTNSRGFRLREGFDFGSEPPRAREEAFPELWEKQPVGLLHLLSASECQPVHEFAVKALRVCTDFIEDLETDAIIMLLSRPYEATATLGFELAEAAYDPSDPDVELVVAVATCENDLARRKAFDWIDSKRELFAKDTSVLLKLLTSKHSNVRDFGTKLLKATNYTDHEAQNLIGVLISEMLAFDEGKNEIAADLGKAVLASFAKNLRTLNLKIVKDLLSHELVEVQEFGGNILLNHETPAVGLSDELINSLIRSEFEEIRAIGVKLFGQLPDENLLKRENVILALLSHELVDVHNSTRPIVLRLAGKHRGFAKNFSQFLFISLLTEEKHEGVNARLLEVLKEIPVWTKFADIETARLLTESDFAEAKEAGGLILMARADDWGAEFTISEIVDFTNNEIRSIRQTSWKLAENRGEKLREDVSYLIRALDAKWADSREFWREVFRKEFTADELTPEVLVAICDSVKEETQKFGRDLLLHYFEEENGTEYLLKLSEHPSPEMQLFATNYLENHAADSPEKFEKLIPYFTRVLSLVNRSRVAKDRCLQFMETEGLKNAGSARLVAKVLARQSATVAIGDKAAMIESMLKLRRNFPGLELPINIKQTEVRG